MLLQLPERRALKRRDCMISRFRFAAQCIRLYPSLLNFVSFRSATGSSLFRNQSCSQETALKFYPAWTIQFYQAYWKTISRNRRQEAKEASRNDCAATGETFSTLPLFLLAKSLRNLNCWWHIRWMLSFCCSFCVSVLWGVFVCRERTLFEFRHLVP